LNAGWLGKNKVGKALILPFSFSLAQISVYSTFSIFWPAWMKFSICGLRDTVMQL
jgi:hypothetical protein